MVRGAGRGRADYNEWGEITYREALTITSSYRRIYPQSNYTGHDWDDVLGMYYAKARFYSADDKRFVSMDPVKGQITDPLSLVPYVYCVDNPLRWVDPLGLIVGRASMVQTMVSDGGGAGEASSPKGGKNQAAKNQLEAIRQTKPTPETGLKQTTANHADTTDKIRQIANERSIKQTKAAATKALNTTSNPRSNAKYLSQKYSLRFECEAANADSSESSLYYDDFADWWTHFSKDGLDFLHNLGPSLWNNQGYWHDRAVNANGPMDWIYSSVNWFTLGLVDNFVQGTHTRWDEMLKTPNLYTVSNYLSAGIVEVFGKAINPKAYNIKFLSFEHLASFGSAIAIGYTAGKGYQATHLDPHTSAHLEYTSSLPGNVAMSQAAMGSHGATETVRVGRWMSVEEYEKMLETGRAQMSYSGPMSHVSYPSDINAYFRKAKPGTIYVEFDINISYLERGGSVGWYYIPGPGSPRDLLNQRRGLPRITEMPIVTNIEVVLEK